MLLKGKTVVLVGGSSGIGLATAELARREGAEVVISSRNKDRLTPVRVNAVSPGIIDTPIRAATPEEARRDMLAKTAAALPVGRVGVGEDIARQILAFMTIGFITGSIVYLDGGAIIS